MADATSIEGKPEIHLLLLGKTGGGKSATGNTILRKEQFRVSGLAKSETVDIMQAWTEIDRYIVKVIDGPGLEDTRINEIEDKERAIDNIGKALLECNIGVNAFLYVMKFGDRFGKEDRNAVEHLKQIIGDKMGDFSVVVLTRGEEWQDEYESYPLEQWCKDNDEYYNGIFSFCGYRCVLFENRKPSADQKSKQINELLAIVTNITMKNGFYTNHLFQETAKERDKLIVKLKAPILKEQYQKHISLLCNRITSVANIQSNDDKIERFKNIVKQAQNLMTLIEKEDKESGVLNDLKRKVNDIVNAAKAHNEDCLQNLANEIETIGQARIFRRRLFTASSIALTVGAAIATGAVSIATGGLAVPLLAAAGGAALAFSSLLGAAQWKIDEDASKTQKKKMEIHEKGKQDS